jgi:hypothetical protein
VSLFQCVLLESSAQNYLSEIKPVISMSVGGVEGRGEALRRGRGGEEVVGKGRVGIGGSKTRRKRGLGARGAGGRGERVRRQ